MPLIRNLGERTVLEERSRLALKALESVIHNDGCIHGNSKALDEARTAASGLREILVEHRIVRAV